MPSTREGVTASGGGEGVGPLDRMIEVAEEAAIRAALERAGGNKTRAAEVLAISRVTLYNKLKKYGLE